MMVVVMGGQIESIISVWLFCLFNQALHGSVGYGRFTVGFVFHPDIVHAKRVIIVCFFVGLSWICMLFASRNQSFRSDLSEV